MLLMDLFAVSISTVNIYLSNDTKYASRAGKRRTGKRTEMGGKGTVNKWPAYLFDEKTNLCTGQNADSILDLNLKPHPAVKVRKIASSLRFPRFCLFFPRGFFSPL